MTRRAPLWPAALLPALLMAAGLLTASGSSLDSAGSQEPTLHMTVTNR